jgi:hypothetical protein
MLDSGSDIHITWNREELSNYVPEVIPLQWSNSGGKILGHETARVTIIRPNNNHLQIIEAHNVMYVPNMHVKLLSMGILNEKGLIWNQRTGMLEERATGRDVLRVFMAHNKPWVSLASRKTQLSKDVQYNATPTTSLAADAPPTTSGGADAPPTTSGGADAPPITTGDADAPPTTGDADAPPTTSDADAPPISSGNADVTPTSLGSADATPITSGGANVTSTTSGSVTRSITYNTGTYNTSSVWAAANAALADRSKGRSFISWLLMMNGGPVLWKAVKTAIAETCTTEAEMAADGLTKRPDRARFKNIRGSIGHDSGDTRCRGSGGSRNEMGIFGRFGARGACGAQHQDLDQLGPKGKTRAPSLPWWGVCCAPGWEAAMLGAYGTWHGTSPATGL